MLSCSVSYYVPSGHPKYSFFFFKGTGPPRVLPSSPTRRSSDLPRTGRDSARGPGGSVMTEKQPEPLGLDHALLSRADLHTVAARLETMELALTFLSKGTRVDRSEEHTSELQSQSNLVCRLLLEK